MKSYISAHLENLIDEFRRYFPDVVNEDTLLIRNPFRCEVKMYNAICRKNLLFIRQRHSKDPRFSNILACHGQQLSSTGIMLCKYCCHSPQCIYVNQPSLHLSSSNRKIETNCRSSVEADLRYALTNNINSRIKQLVASKQKQKSH